MSEKRKNPQEMTEDEYVADPCMRASSAFSYVLNTFCEVDAETGVMLTGLFIRAFDSITEEEMRRRHRVIVSPVGREAAQCLAEGLLRKRGKASGRKKGFEQ